MARNKSGGVAECCSLILLAVLLANSEVKASSLEDQKTYYAPNPPAPVHIPPPVHVDPPHPSSPPHGHGHRHGHGHGHGGTSHHHPAPAPPTNCDPPHTPTPSRPSTPTPTPSRPSTPTPTPSRPAAPTPYPSRPPTPSRPSTPKPTPSRPSTPKPTPSRPSSPPSSGCYNPPPSPTPPSSGGCYSPPTTPAPVTPTPVTPTPVTPTPTTPTPVTPTPTPVTPTPVVPVTPPYAPIPGITPTPTTPTAPSPPFVFDPNNPFGGTCDFWRSHPTFIWGVVGWFGTINNAMGGNLPSLPGLPSSLNLLHALSNTRTDGYGALYREGTASLLNSMVNSRFAFSTVQVRDHFVASLGSNKAAAAQAKVFRMANEGHLKPKA